MQHLGWWVGSSHHQSKTINIPGHPFTNAYQRVSLPSPSHASKYSRNWSVFMEKVPRATGWAQWCTTSAMPNGFRDRTVSQDFGAGIEHLVWVPTSPEQSREAWQHGKNHFKSRSKTYLPMVDSTDCSTPYQQPTCMPNSHRAKLWLSFSSHLL